MIKIYEKVKGSFTVEAALIMPVILGVIVLSDYISMFAYDRCVIEYVCQSVCADAAFDLSGHPPGNRPLIINRSHQLVVAVHLVVLLPGGVG